MEHEDCYNEVFTKVIELQGRYSDPMIAGNMMVHALRIYKSILNADAVDVVEEKEEGGILNKIKSFFKQD